MGLLVLAACSTAMEVALLHETFQKQKEEFANFIFDARCFVFGVQNGKPFFVLKAQYSSFKIIQILFFIKFDKVLFQKMISF